MAEKNMSSLFEGTLKRHFICRAGDIGSAAKNDEGSKVSRVEGGV